MSRVAIRIIVQAPQHARVLDPHSRARTDARGGLSLIARSGCATGWPRDGSAEARFQHGFTRAPTTPRPASGLVSTSDIMNSGAYTGCFEPWRRTEIYSRDGSFCSRAAAWNRRSRRPVKPPDHPGGCRGADRGNLKKSRLPDVVRLPWQNNPDGCSLGLPPDADRQPYPRAPSRDLGDRSASRCRHR